MKESFEKKPRNLETEAASYEVEAMFSPAEIRKEAEAIAGTTYKFLLSYIISDTHKLYLSLTGHFTILKRIAEKRGLKGGMIEVNGKLRVLDVSGVSGTAVVGAVYGEDLPLIKKIAQRYLDGIKETKN